MSHSTTTPNTDISISCFPLPHRANLLNPSYNVVGLAVVRSGDRIYIVQDFGSALPKYSSAEAKNHVAAAVNQMRRQASRPELQRRDWLGADDAACSMAQADKIGVPADRNMAEALNVLTYTTLHPETLPASAARTVTGRTLHLSPSAPATPARPPIRQEHTGSCCRWSESEAFDSASHIAYKDGSPLLCKEL